MKSLLLFLLLSVACLAVEYREPVGPNIPAHNFLAAELGVVPDSGKPITEALQQAVDKVARSGGGRLTLSKGTYLCGPLHLPGRFDLHLDRDAVLQLLPLGADFPTENGRYLSFLTAADVHDLRLSGEGVIDGGGEPWWKAFRAKELKLRRPQLIGFEQCERVEISGITLRNPPNTHMALRLCREVRLLGLTLRAPGNSPNTDGLNLSGKNYLIANCDISTGDDNIVFLTHAAKGWTPPVCENLLVRDCRLGEGHGLSIGSFTGGGIRGLRVERCRFEGTTSGIRLKADRNRGGLVENLWYRDITMRDVKYPVYVTSYYPKTPKTPEEDAGTPSGVKTPHWQSLVIENLRAEGCENSVVLWGLPEAPLCRVLFRQVVIKSKASPVLYHVDGVQFDHVDLQWTQDGPARVYKASGKGLAGLPEKP